MPIIKNRIYLIIENINHNKLFALNLQKTFSTSLKKLFLRIPQETKVKIAGENAKLYQKSDFLPPENSQ